MSTIAQAPAPPLPATTSSSSDDSEWGPWQIAGLVACAAVGAACGYHGYVRNDDSAGWGVVWGILGFAAPIVTLPVALVQGFAVPSDSVRLGRLEGVIAARPELAAAMQAEMAKGQ